MRMDRFTTLAQEVLSASQSLASTRSNPEVTTLHVLLSLLEDSSGIAGSILAKAGVDDARVKEVAEAELGRLPHVTGAQPHTSPATIQLLQQAEKEAASLGDSFISTEHLLLALMETRDQARNILETCGALPPRYRQRYQRNTYRIWCHQCQRCQRRKHL